jgi:hypothetical protein
MALMVNRDAPYSGLSSLMAMQGRYGDTELVHMSKPEIQGLASLGELTINPDTGLPEAFSLKRILPVAAGIAGSILLPAAAPALASSLGATGAAALGTGLGTFGGGLIAGQKPGEALLGGVTSGLMSFGIGSLLGGATPGLSEGTANVADSAISGATGFEGAFGPDSVAGELAGAFSPEAAAQVINPATGTGTIGAQLSSMPIDPIFETVPTYSLSKAYEPSTLGKLIGKEAIPAGDITREQFIQLGGTPSDATFKEVALQKAKDPFTYAPLGIAALTGGLEEPYQEPEPEARKPIETDFGKVEIVGGDVRRPIPTEAEYLRRAVEGGSQRYFEPYRYLRRAAEGGIVGLQQGGMATPQAPSAMSAMLTPPVQQPQPIQPINIAVQPPQQQPQQPQPMAPMGQGPAPLPDQQKEFMKLMDMEEQVQGQKQAAALQGTSALAGLLSSAEGMMQQYPQTSPSGQAVQPPSPPPMTYGSQVNLGLAGGGQPYFEGQVEGPGDGQSDEVAFRVDGGQVDGAMLSPDEYVLAADVVSAIGNGSSDAGAEKLDQFMKNVRQDAYGTTKQMKPFDKQGLTNLVA